MFDYHFHYFIKHATAGEKVKKGVLLVLIPPEPKDVTLRYDWFYSNHFESVNKRGFY